MACVRVEVEDGFEIDAAGDLLVTARELTEVELLVPRAHRVALHETVGIVTREARFDECQQDALAEEEVVAPSQVAAHALTTHDEPVDQPGEAVEHVIE